MLMNDIYTLRIKSPSLGREWIEMQESTRYCNYSGSPSLGREWIEIDEYENQMHAEFCLPPWGGSGLKWRYAHFAAANMMSPSLGREWIEIVVMILFPHLFKVSLLGEGVD